jgi:hypothetical protein
LDNNGDFKILFCTTIFYYYKYIFSKHWNPSSNPWGFVHVQDFDVLIVPRSMEKFVVLRNTTALKFERAHKVSCIIICIWLTLREVTPSLLNAYTCAHDLFIRGLFTLYKRL